MIYKALHGKLKIEHHEPTKTRSELMCSSMISKSYSTSAVRRHQLYVKLIDDLVTVVTTK